jgi:hypothetical protein
MNKPEPFTESTYRARLDARANAPRLIDWGRTVTVLEYPSLDAAVANAEVGTAYMEAGPRAAWDEYLASHREVKRWHGGVQSADEWKRTVAAPPAKLAKAVAECMDALDAVPLPMQEAPRRRTMRNLDEGDTLDAVRMVEDFNLDRAWSERRRSTRPRPALRIVLNSGINCNLDERALAWRGAAALAIARRAEDAGADVELLAAVNWTRCARDAERDIVASWPLKAFGQHADRDTLTAYCCHFAAFRWFAWILMAQNMPGHQVCSAWGSMRPLASVVPHLRADIVVDYDVITKDRAIGMMHRAAQIVEERR